ncbi:DUF4402 domain-containing protein [uncultured Bacteroides sp.]|uniref:DUF4402 domain-containing protein n=1 Tax=uncultured Bacteroides sp. TaxID=162156 RepID=UPI002AAC0D30|nr:DUF4402 domain-containing protein [uncultured Bacteroides sp.]
MNKLRFSFREKQIVLLLSFIFCLSFYSTQVKGQNYAPDLPQRSGTVSSTQNLQFGDLTIQSGSSGGTVSVGYDGSRTATGNVCLLNLGNTPHQAIFEFKLCPGRTVTITYPETTLLTGSNGGSITLHVGPTNFGTSGSVFTSNKGCDDVHLIYVGGTIDVGSIASNPAGLYTGSFSLTFVQE